LKASISLAAILDSEPGRFEVEFQVSTDGCESSACSGFDATLVIQVDDDNFASQRYSFGGWSAGESSGSDFTIVRNGSLAGLSLNDVEDIEQPDFVCHDD
jgi:hypothetical protein